MASSKHQEVEVLDNWEDIDDPDVSTSRMQHALERYPKPIARLPRIPREFPNKANAIANVLERQFSNMETPSQNKCNGLNAPFNIILTGEDALRSQYVPPEPTVTILKRPTKQNHTNNGIKVMQPKKTLKQREQEYAEARLRILGEAASPEKPDETRFACIQNKVTRQIEDNVIRMPKGPDGTKGFAKR